jgi:hypothetical protein
MKPLMLQTHWEQALHPMLDMINRFPKAQRFVFGQPMAKLVIDILMDVQSCRFLHRSVQYDALSEINQNLDKLRLLFRICHDRRFISTTQLEWVTTQCHTFGSALHAWRKRCPLSNG